MNSDDPLPQPEPESTSLPFTKILPFIVGILFGISIRLVYSGQPGGAYSAMTWPFVYLAPFVVGAVTVYFAERQKRRSYNYYFVASIIANALFILGTLMILIEGIICAIIILPLFCTLGAIGGVFMGAVCRISNWPKQTLCVIALLPVVLGGADDSNELPTRIETIERTVNISATPEIIWDKIIYADEISPQVFEKAWLHHIGVPLPQSGTFQETRDTRIRRVTMGKDIYFDERITDMEEYKYIGWVYQYYEDSFPPYALDEHVVLGGHYFDFIDTSYTLEKQDEFTQLTIRMTYRVSTRFNWYAGPVADLLIGNLSEANLAYYKHRSED